MYHKNYNIEDLLGEEWIDALGFDGIYEVSNLGRIKSLGRLVNNGGSGRWVKERIRKQVKVKDGRLTCLFSVEGKAYSINVPGIIFFSFNPDKDYESSKFCIMHKNKIKIDNRLVNLELTSFSKSHALNWEKGLLPHLKINNALRTEKYNALTHKTCKECKTRKKIETFEFGRNTCADCRNKNKIEKYYSKNEKQRGFKIKVEDLVTKKIYVFENTVDQKLNEMFSIPTIRRVINERDGLYEPYRSSKYPNPCKISKIKH